MFDRPLKHNGEQSLRTGGRAYSRDINKPGEVKPMVLTLLSVQIAVVTMKSRLATLYKSISGMESF